MREERDPVLIVGGGHAGLTAAVCLAWRGVRPLLVERHPRTSRQPKAFGLPPRTMEVLRQIPGLEAGLMRESTFDSPPTSRSPLPATWPIRTRRLIAREKAKRTAPAALTTSLRHERPYHA